MRILSVARGFEDYIVELANALSVHVEVHLVVSLKDEWVCGSLDPSVRTFKSRAPRVNSLGNSIALLRIVKHIRRIRPDIIHLQSGVSWELALKVLFPRIPMIVTMHDITKHPSWSGQSLTYTFQQWTLDMAMKLSDALIVHGESMLERATGYCRARGLSKIIESIPHGIISRYGNGVARVHSSPSGNVLFFGFLNKYKGVEYLIRAEPLIRKKLPCVNIRIEGFTDRTSYYRSLLCQDSKIQMVLKRADDKRVSELFQWADAIILPYIEASQSGVLQLAMAFAVPPVVTRVGGLPEVVVDGVTGLVVPPSDEVALADAIIELLTNAELRSRIIFEQQKARNGVFSWENIAQQTLELYLRVLQRAST